MKVGSRYVVRSPNFVGFLEFGGSMGFMECMEFASLHRERTPFPGAPCSKPRMTQDPPTHSVVLSKGGPRSWSEAMRGQTVPASLCAASLTLVPAINICVAHRCEVFLRRFVALPYFLLFRCVAPRINAVVKSYKIGGPLSLAQCDYRRLLTQNLSLQ